MENKKKKLEWAVDLKDNVKKGVYGSWMKDHLIVDVMDNDEDEKEELNIETIAAYWSHRGFVGMELGHKIMDTLDRGEIVDDDNDACKVCE